MNIDDKRANPAAAAVAEHYIATAATTLARGMRRLFGSFRKRRIRIDNAGVHAHVKGSGEHQDGWANATSPVVSTLVRCITGGDTDKYVEITIHHNKKKLKTYALKIPAFKVAVQKQRPDF